MAVRRIGAVLLAVALIAGALLLRRNIIEDDVVASDTTTPPVATATIVCVTELQAACDAIAADGDIDVVVEAAGVTLDRFAASDDIPVWLTLQPYPAMLDELRSAAGVSPVGWQSDALAASQLSVATPVGGRSDVLAAACAGVPLWRCLGERAGDPWTDLGGEASWNTVRPSLGAVEREAVALASFANAVAGYFGSAQLSSSTFSDPAFIAWLRRLSGTVDESQLSAGTPLGTMAVRPSLDVAATTEAERGAVGGDRFDANYPDPTMWVEAVLAVPEGVGAPDGVAASATDALLAAGWSDPSSAAQPVPSAPTMLALRSLWAEVT